jgi:hypothetical protein
MHIFKNYQCANPSPAWQPIATNQSNVPNTSPDSGQTKYTIISGFIEKKNCKR